MAALESINPATGEISAVYDRHSDREVERRLERAADDYATWRETSLGERTARFRALARRLRERAPVLAELIASEMGKPREQGLAEIKKCAAACDYYALHAEELLAPETVTADGDSCRVVYRPQGAVLALMPWNFPLWQVLRFAVPTLLAGNVAVLRHASNVTGCALAVEELFREAEAPLTLLLVEKDRVAKLIGDARIRAVTLTGSPGAGREVAAAAGRALKKTVLELGGSDPYLVLADADLDAAVATCVTSRLLNSGQSCIAAKRFIVERSVHDQFVEAFVAAMRTKRAKDPLEPDADLGPLAQARGRERLHEQVQRSIAAGAKCVLGGELPSTPGFFYPPTVLEHVRPGMPAFDDEVFGPVAAIVAGEDLEDAIELANRSRYGLGAAVFTANAERARRVAERRLEAGNCFINDFVRSDPRLPFGGIKESGYGRELGAFGIKEFVNVKTIRERWTEPRRPPGAGGPGAGR